ncbi:hypothetical protein GCM10010433_51940 [Streptomyces pulveraceus]
MQAFGLVAQFAVGVGLDLPGPVAEPVDRRVLAALPGLHRGERPVDVGPGLLPYLGYQARDVPFDGLELSRLAL